MYGREEFGHADVEILIVEDSPTQAEQLKYIVEHRGYRALVAKNGREALALMHEHKPTLVLSDVVMPEVDGYELCRRITTDEQLKEIPVILLTSLSDPQDVIKGLENGAKNFITKPYHEHYLLARIEHTLTNLELRKSGGSQMGVEIFFAGHKHFITADRLQILDLLLSAYETAVQKNQELTRLQEELQALNESLEKKVEDRTAALRVEIAERRRAEAEVRELNLTLEHRVEERTRQLQEAIQQLEAFSYSISHDLRAPLRAIDGFSGILLEDYAEKLDAEGKRLLGSIRSNTQKMSQLIDDLLAFSRVSRQEIAMSAVSMDALTRAVIAELSPTATNKRMRIDIQPLPPALGDPAMIYQILVNLLSNAMKFSRTKEAPVIELGGRPEGDYNLYFCKDNGVGFDMKLADKLFGVFQRLHSEREFEGTGVGLAIVQRIIQRHGGQIWAEAEVGHGATFYFTLPRG
jgi:two-component system sensor histidine kinase/response regulator